MNEPTKEQIDIGFKAYCEAVELARIKKIEAALRAALEVKPDHISETNKMVDESAIRADERKRALEDAALFLESTHFVQDQEYNWVHDPVTETSPLRDAKQKRMIEAIRKLAEKEG